jgi:TetR/AcrR family acrAB operon transcriptional repressor
MVRRTKQEAQETRNRILDAAEQVFHERGVARASLEDIAAHAEVTRGAIYWHFRDKAELFEAMMQRVMLPAEEMLGCNLVSCAADPLASLRKSACDVLLRTARDARTRRVMDIAYNKCEYVGDATGVRDRHIASQMECLGAIEGAFRAAIAQGQLPSTVHPREAAIGAMSLVSGLIANWVLDPKSFSLEQHAVPLVEAYFRGLEATPAASSSGSRLPSADRRIAASAKKDAMSSIAGRSASGALRRSRARVKA